MTANAVAMNDGILQSTGIGHGDDLVIADLRHGENFSAIMEDRGSFDNAGTKEKLFLPL